MSEKFSKQQTVWYAGEDFSSLSGAPGVTLDAVACMFLQCRLAMVAADSKTTPYATVAIDKLTGILHRILQTSVND